MSYGKIAVGDKWGCMECLEIGDKKRVDEESGTIWASASYYLLRCDCGAVKEVFLSDWKGQRRHRDCGCGIGMEDRFYAPISVTVPMEIRRKVGMYRMKHNLTLSRAVVELIRLGFKQARIEGDTDGMMDDADKRVVGKKW